MESCSSPSLLRSSSLATGLKSSTAAANPLRSSNDEINSKPQDFVLVDGKKFRMNRDRFQDNNVEGNSPNRLDEKDMGDLKQALSNANVLISQQNDLILKQARRIQKLEEMLKISNNQTTAASISTIAATTYMKDCDAPSRNTESGGTSASDQSEDVWPQPSPRMNGAASASRRRSEALEIAKLQSMPSPSPEKEDISPSSNMTNTRGFKSSSMSSSATSHEDWSTTSLISTIKMKPAGPSRASSDSSTSAYSEVASEASTSPPTLNLSKTGPTTPPSGPPKGLAARLAMGSQERRRLASGGRSSTTNVRISPRLISPRTGTPPTPTSLAVRTNTEDDHHYHRLGGVGSMDMESDEIYRINDTSPLLSVPSSSSLFKWQNSSSSGSVYLFIAHDNPQVGATVATRLKTEGSMHVMLESKEDSGLTCFLLGSIVYSGSIEGVECADLQMPRGSQFIVCSRMTAYRADISAFPSRVRGDISEIDLDGCGVHGKIDVSTAERVTAFLRGCTARVDVILDPSHSQLWYPYFEGRRKMAPQFRSQGVGYLRLGDDMSRYGSAFLSLDAGKSFLDGGATSIIAPSSKSPMTLQLSKTYPGAIGLPSTSPIGTPSTDYSSTMTTGKRSARHSGSRRKLSIDDEHQSDNGGGISGCGSISEGESETEGFLLGSPVLRRTASKGDIVMSKELDEVRQTLQLLTSPDFKWAERVESLRRLHNAIINITSLTTNTSNPASSSSGTVNSSMGIPEALLTEVLSVLNVNVTKQKNPHVLRSAVCCVRVVGGYAAGTASCGMAWRSLLLETIHLLRSSVKAVYEESKDTLLGLHCGAAGAAKWTISISALTSMLPDILAGPRGKGSNGASSGTAKVIQWLEALVTAELDCLLDVWAMGMGAGTKPYSLCADKVDIASTLQKCQPLLVHREEACRDAVVSFCGALLLYELLQHASSLGSGGWDVVVSLVDRVMIARNDNTQTTSTSTPNTNNNIRSRSSTPVRSTPGGSTGEDVSMAAMETIQASLGTATSTAIQEAAKIAPRMRERVLAAAVLWLLAKAGKAVTAFDSHSRVDISMSPTSGTSGSGGGGGGIAFRNERMAAQALIKSGILAGSKSAPVSSPVGSPKSIMNALEAEAAIEGKDDTTQGQGRRRTRTQQNS